MLLKLGHPLEERDEIELNTICAQLYQLLSIVQGVVLHHGASKAFLGRRYPLEVRVVYHANASRLKIRRSLQPY